MQWERGGASPSRAWVSQWREQQCGGLGRKHTPRAPAAFLVRRAGCVRPTCAGSAPSATSRPVAVAASLVSRLSFRLLLRESVLPRRAVGRNTRNEEASALSKRKLGIPEPQPSPARSCCPAPHGGPVRSAFCPSVVVLTETFLRRACFWGRFSNDRCSDRICLTVYIEGHRGPQGPRKGGSGPGRRDGGVLCLGATAAGPTRPAGRRGDVGPLHLPRRKRAWKHLVLLSAAAWRVSVPRGPTP